MKQIVIGLFALTIFVLFQTSNVFAASQSQTGTYITGYAYIYPATSDGSIISNLSVYKSSLPGTAIIQAI
jgi:hypothetical protein